MKIYMFILTVFSLSFFGCSNDDGSQPQTDSDYLIFGHFYGMCHGDDCMATFKLTGDALYIGNPAGDGSFEFTELPTENFNIAKGLLEKIPDKLLDEDDQTFGCPDCADQGGMYIQVSVNGKVQTWLLDQNKARVPDYLHQFMDEINAAIWELIGWE